MLATDEQKKRFLPKFVSGEEMWAIAMTEPGTGSDLAGMKSTAKLSEDARTTSSTAPRPSSPAACTPTV
ncbi:hypothetical protein SVIOM74S_05737 [Streptomyces violarus]